MTGYDAETDAIVAELEAARILTATTEDDGTVTYALTREGKAIARQVAMTEGDIREGADEIATTAKSQSRAERALVAIADTATDVRTSSAGHVALISVNGHVEVRLPTCGHEKSPP